MRRGLAYVALGLAKAGARDPDAEAARLALVGYLSGWMARTEAERKF